LSKSSRNLRMVGAGLAMVALGKAATQENSDVPLKPKEIERRQQELIAYYESDYVPRIPPDQRAHLRSRTNFDPTLPKNPTSLFGFSIGDWVSVELHSYQGIGQIIAIDTQEHGGTLMFPVLAVRLDDLGIAWLTAAPLEHIEPPAGR
jgi:hypothetical protein